MPYLRSYRRDFHLIRGRHLLVVDEVELEQDGQVQWLMQLMARPQLGQNSFRHEGERGGITGEFVFCSSGPVSLSTVEGFDDVDPGRDRRPAAAPPRDRHHAARPHAHAW